MQWYRIECLFHLIRRYAASGNYKVLGFREGQLHYRKKVDNAPNCDPMRSTEAAAKCIKRHLENVVDPAAEALIVQLETASTAEQADAAGKAFKDWAESEGL